MPVELFMLRGDLAAATLAPWVERHARRLGLSARIRQKGTEVLTLEVAGPPELLDAMEMGCLLGPIEAWVEMIWREPLVSQPL